MALERLQRQLAEVAEDGRARPAHRRRRARLQQSPDDRHRQHPDALKKIAAQRSEGRARRAGHRDCGAARCSVDPPAADVLPAPARQSASDRHPRSASSRSARCSTSGLGGGVSCRSILPTTSGRSMVDIGEFEIALVNLVDQCPRCHAGRRHGHRHRARTSRSTKATRCRGDYVAIAVAGHRRRHSARRHGPRCSIRSSPPSRSARAPGWGCRRCMALRIRPGGTVKIDSKLGEGTAVTIYLPRATSAAAGADAVGSDAEPAGNAAPCCWSRTIPTSRARAPACSNNSAIRSMGAECRRCPASDRNGRHRRRLQRHRHARASIDGLGLARMIKQKRPRSADPAGHRLQRSGAECAARFSDPSQALPDARAEPRAGRFDAGLTRRGCIAAGVASGTAPKYSTA